VQYRGVSEDYSEQRPEIIGYSALYKPIDWCFLRARTEVEARSLRIRFGPPPIGTLFKEMRRRSPDLILMKGLNSVLALSTLVLARVLRIKCIVLIQREWLKSQTILERCRSFILFRVLGVASVASPISKHTWSAPANHPRFAYLPFVYDVVELDRDYFQNDSINILNVGKFSPTKGQITLLKAVGQLHSRFPVAVTLIGARVDERYLAKLRDLVRELGLESMVHFELDLDHETVLKAFRSADLFVLSSDREPASLQVLEAMANGVPVISSDRNGTKCYIEKGKSGCLFRARDSDDLAIQMNSIMRDRRALRQMGLKGAQIAAEDHSLAQFCRALDRLVD